MFSLYFQCHRRCSYSYLRPPLEDAESQRYFEKLSQKERDRWKDNGQDESGKAYFLEHA